MTTTHYDIEADMHYLQLLSQTFPTIADASTEIINLEAIMALPKGTEHFLADIHGESGAFQHVLKNASGNIKRKVNELFGNDIRESEKKELCTLIYYPEQKLELIKAREEDLEDWYRITIHQLVKVCRDVSSKYTRSKVRKSLPEEFSYIIQELLHESLSDSDKAAYVSVIVNTIISTGRADDFIVAICNVIQRLAIDQLHILGDIYDRGPGAHIVMDTLRQYHAWDIQWGNHPAMMLVSAMYSDYVYAMQIWLQSRNTALTSCLSQHLPLKLMAMTHARSSCRRSCQATIWTRRHDSLLPGCTKPLPSFNSRRKQQSSSAILSG